MLVTPEWLEEWRENLLQQPPTCRRRALVGGRVFLLLLTWRRCDPWEFRIIELGSDGVRVSDELFEPEGFYFESDEWKKAEAAAESIFTRLALRGELDAVVRHRQLFNAGRARSAWKTTSWRR